MENGMEPDPVYAYNNTGTKYFVCIMPSKGELAAVTVEHFKSYLFLNNQKLGTKPLREFSIYLILLLFY